MLRVIHRAWDIITAALLILVATVDERRLERHSVFEGVSSASCCHIVSSFFAWVMLFKFSRWNRDEMKKTVTSFYLP